MYCNFSICADEKLYSYIWYKDNKQFYRIITGESSEIEICLIDGVHVDESLSTNESIVLKKLEPVSSGTYMCEVTGETVSGEFVFESNYCKLKVLPFKRPYIPETTAKSTNKSENLLVDTNISVNCSPRKCIDILILLSFTYYIVLFK